MKKLTLLFFLFGIGMSTLLAQTITITGTVSSSVENEGPVPGASVQLKGAGTGTITDVDGAFSINVPQDATTLVFSCVGMKQQEVEIEGRTVIYVVMEPEIISLDEVTITTGYEIKRAPRSSSALTQVVSGDKLNEVRQTNINSALVGKVSGIQFRGQSALALDRTGSINLRGDGGFSTGNSVLYVVDGTIITNSGDLNLDDIEDISVLSGPGASALLGSQAANGAIIITTKKAKLSGASEMEIEINSGLSSSSVYILPEYQNDYAGGGLGSMIQYSWKTGDPIEWQSLDGKFYPDYEDDRNWGPKMEGQEYIPWYSWYPGTKYTGTTASLIPQPDNVRNFYDRGWTYNNNIAFSKSGEDFRIRAVFGNVAVKGNIPGSSSNKTHFAIKTSYDLTKKLTIGTNINFYTTLINGEFNDKWANQTTGSFNEFFHRDLDMNILRELRGLKTPEPEGIYASWNHKAPTVYDSENPEEFYAATLWYNHFTFFDLIDLPSRSDRLFGDISLNYKIINGLSAKITYRRQQVSGWREEKYSSDLNKSLLYNFFYPEFKGYYLTGNFYSTRENIESLITFSKKIDDFSINANAGSDFSNTISKSTSANTNNGLSIPNLFSIENSVDQPEIRNSRANEKYRALFLRGDVGYKNFLFGEFSLRKDWYSTFPPSANSIFSKSFGVSFIFSDLLHFSFLNHGKVRASWGEIPTAIGAYVYPGGQYDVELYRRYENIMMSTPDLVDEDIHGAVKTQKELGLDLLFFNYRVGLNATWWDGTEKDIPYEVPVAGYSGFSSRYMNTGKIVKQGLDFTLHLKPIIRSNLNYELNAAFSYLIRNDVVSIGEGIESFFVSNYFLEGWPQMVHAVGRPWGELRGNGIKMLEGKPVVDDDGYYVIDNDIYFGSVLPKMTGGVQNSIRILKNFTVIANIDFQIGGRYASVSQNTADWSGLSTRTTGLNNKGNPIRDPVAEGGGIHVIGVLEDGTAYDDYIEPFDYYDNLWVFDSYVYKLTYVKLRELSIGYRIPVEHIRGLSNTMKAINISFFCINPWLIYSESKGFDPSEITSVYGEEAQYPSTRSFGLNLKVNF
ncbi:MAG: SusC/RagA family TonB-linked outer membrane protein [Bacteroidia bacterium]|nr:MAG: SusC/RagA family TonB-linked outer membrane protein [Bacteroidia bacterium]